MNKVDMIATMAEVSGLSKKDCEAALTAFLAATEKALKAGDKVQLVGFVNISSLSDTPDRKKSDTLTAKILHPFRIDGAWRPHGLRTAATPLDHSEIAFSRLMDSPLMVST